MANNRAGKPDRRGNSIDRRNRKVWMLITPKFGGNGTHVNCVHCGKELDYTTVEADRIQPGGSYRRDNVQPACRSCNSSRANDINWKYEGASA